MGFKVARKAMLVVLCAMGFCCFGEEERHATGLLIPPHRRRAVSAESASDAPCRAKSLLGAAKANNESLPERWDSREHYTDGLSWISPVRDQGNFNSCWAFASYATLETQMRKLGMGDWDFSEKNLVNLHGYDLLNYNSGGYEDMAEGYLLRWGGAIAETNDSYSATSWSSSEPLNPPIHVQNVVWVPMGDSNALKKAIVEYGAVGVSMRYDGNYQSSENKGAYYYNNSYYSASINHAVTVIGWDDGYSASKFNRTPAGDGAWLVKNSHGENSGDDGYLHVSYYDKSFARYTDGAIYIPATKEENFTAVYGYDRWGPSAYELDGYGCPIAAIFTSSFNEELAAIGLYSCVYPLEYSFSVYTNLSDDAINPTSGGVLARTQTGTLEKPGFFTIPLEEPLKLAPTNDFSIIFENTTECQRYFAVCTTSLYATVEMVAGKTFFNVKGAWRDSTTISDLLTWTPEVQPIPAFGNICLKAYTRSTVAAKDSGPGETADGTKMCEAVAATNSVLYAQAAQTFGAFANIVGDNSRSLWYSWMAGLDPSDPADDFTVSLTLTNNVPYLTWSPDNLPQRTYTIYGTSSLTGGKWEKIAKSALKTTTNKFFKVEIDAN